MPGPAAADSSRIFSAPAGGSAAGPIARACLCEQRRCILGRMRGPGEADEEAGLSEALDGLLRFGAMALRSGATAFRVREWMGAIARGMGIDSLAVHISLGAMTATLRRGGASATRASEVAPIGINA